MHVFCHVQRFQIIFHSNILIFPFKIFGSARFFFNILLPFNFKLGATLQLQEKIRQSVYQHHKANGFNCNDPPRIMLELWKNTTKISFPHSKDCSNMHTCHMFLHDNMSWFFNFFLLYIWQNFTVLGLQVYSHVYFLYFHQLSTY